MIVLKTLVEPAGPASPAEPAEPADAGLLQALELRDEEPGPRLVEAAWSAGAPRSSRDLVDAAEQLLESLLSFQQLPLAASLLLLPHSAEAAEPCAAVATELVARLFKRLVLKPVA